MDSNDKKTVSARLGLGDIDFLTRLGGGNLSAGIRKLVSTAQGTGTVSTDGRTMASRVAEPALKSISAPPRSAQQQVNAHYSAAPKFVGKRK